MCALNEKVRLEPKRRSILKMTRHAQSLAGGVGMCVPDADPSSVGCQDARPVWFDDRLSRVQKRYIGVPQGSLGNSGGRELSGIWNFARGLWGYPAAGPTTSAVWQRASRARHPNCCVISTASQQQTLERTCPPCKHGTLHRQFDLVPSAASPFLTPPPPHRRPTVW